MSMLSLTACASCTTTDDDPITENPAPDPTPGTEAGDNVSVLVAYFHVQAPQKALPRVSRI